MNGGYQGKILRIDLVKKIVSDEKLDFKAAQNFIGGSGLAAHYLIKETDSEKDPLVFMTGPFTGTAVPGSDRFAVAAKSPLTGIWGEADCGGKWGEMLKKCGYDGIIIEGRSSTPVYLYVENNKATIMNAEELWGMDTFQTTDFLENKHGQKTRTACIGPAGEKQVKIAGILTEGIHARMAARCGLGAVMGSKKLKAVTVYGNQSSPCAHKNELISSIRQISKSLKENLNILTTYGTAVNISYIEPLGDIPIKNFSQGTWQEGVDNLNADKLNEYFLKDNYYCGRCIVGCGRVVNNKIMLGGPEYETLAMLGMNCMVSSLDGVIRMMELCNRMGIDVISTGNIISFAMEAFEKGLITEADTEGINLTWGNVEAILSVIEQIAQKKGIGALLGRGVRAAAETLGHGAEEFAQHAKGLEMPAHDPRAKFATALAYATSNRGACHLQAFTTEYESAEAFPELGYKETLDRFQVEGKGPFTAKLQNVMALCDSLKICKFMLLGGVNLKTMCDWLNAITGWNLDVNGLLLKGEAIFNLKRLYNNRMGITKKHDTLSNRVLKQSLDKGGAAGKLPPLETMLDEYYSYRKWDSSGVPSLEKIEELQLTDYHLEK